MATLSNNDAHDLLTQAHRDLCGIYERLGAGLGMSKNDTPAQALIREVNNKILDTRTHITIRIDGATQ